MYVIISLYNLTALLSVSLISNDLKKNPFHMFSGHLDIFFCKGLVKIHYLVLIGLLLFCRNC